MCYICNVKIRGQPYSINVPRGTQNFRVMSIVNKKDISRYFQKYQDRTFAYEVSDYGSFHIYCYSHYLGGSWIYLFSCSPATLRKYRKMYDLNVVRYSYEK